MLGKWNYWYRNLKRPGSWRYGNTITYQLAADFLKGLEVEDWGCGPGGFKRVYKGPKYTGVDGSNTPFADKIVDLRTYQTQVEGIVMRHVLEHNYDWSLILQNALTSFNKRFCLILFTPFQDETKEIAHNLKDGVDCPDIGFKQSDIETFLQPFKWHMETRPSHCHYKIEHIYYIER